MSRNVLKMSPNSLQISQNVSKLSPNVSTCLQISPNVSKYHQMSSNVALNYLVEALSRAETGNELLALIDTYLDNQG